MVFKKSKKWWKNFESNFFLHSMKRTSTKVYFSPISNKKAPFYNLHSTLEMDKLLLSYLALCSIINLAHDFKSSFIDIDIVTISEISKFLEPSSMINSGFL